MKFKKYAKLICSVIISLLLMNGACIFYYNIPAHVHSNSGATDHVWESNRFYSKGTEGFAWGKTDENGFNNLVALDSDDVDVLFIGSSHTEAFHVLQDENFVSQFDCLMSDNGVGLKSYNIGIASHNFARCLNNFEAAVKEYSSAKYIVIETSSVKPSYYDLQKIKDGTFEELVSTSNPLIVLMQKIPFVRRVYAQLSNIKKSNTKTQISNAIPIQNELVYEALLNDTISTVAEIADGTGAHVIIFYHNNLNIDKDGALSERDNSEDINLFKSVCEKNGIIFADMYSAFAENYNETYHLPHGFSNTAVGEGHLNKYGHKVIANELYELILDLESQSKVVA